MAETFTKYDCENMLDRIKREFPTHDNSRVSNWTVDHYNGYRIEDEGRCPLGSYRHSSRELYFTLSAVYETLYTISQNSTEENK